MTCEARVGGAGIGCSGISAACGVVRLVDGKRRQRPEDTKTDALACGFVLIMGIGRDVGGEISDALDLVDEKRCLS